MPIRRILIIDDEELGRSSLADFMEEAGYTTRQAESGRRAVALQKEEPADLCIVDIRMPGMDGVETIQALHQLAPQTRFIVYTGSPQFSLPGTLAKMGISERLVVYKPLVDMGVLLDLIEQLEREPPGTRA